MQKVYFRKYTQEYATGLGLVGYVQNNSDGSVSGFAQGSIDKVTKLKHWLQHTGSPKSRIDKADFVEAAEDLSYTSFIIKK